MYLQGAQAKNKQKIMKCGYERASLEKEKDK